MSDTKTCFTRKPKLLQIKGKAKQSKAKDATFLWVFLVSSFYLLSLMDLKKDKAVEDERERDKVEREKSQKEPQANKYCFLFVCIRIM